MPSALHLSVLGRVQTPLKSKFQTLAKSRTCEQTVHGIVMWVVVLSSHEHAPPNIPLYGRKGQDWAERKWCHGTSYNKNRQSQRLLGGCQRCLTGGQGLGLPILNPGQGLTAPLRCWKHSWRWQECSSLPEAGSVSSLAMWSACPSFLQRVHWQAPLALQIAPFIFFLMGANSFGESAILIDKINTMSSQYKQEALRA